ncbi:MAG: hypothetical protein R3E83_15595 [Burkholderiaceae bacterium]
MIEQLEHVGHDLTLRVGRDVARHRRATVATHVGRDAAKAKGRKGGSWWRQLIASSGQPWMKTSTGPFSGRRPGVVVAIGFVGVSVIVMRGARQ